MTEPVEMRRLLRLELRRLRNEAELTQRQVADRMDWSPSKVIRIENGHVPISVTDLRALLEYYDREPRRSKAELEEFARRSKRLPFEEYRSVLSDDTVRYFEFERMAGTLRQFEPLAVPGLLQIPGYTRALLEVRGQSVERVDQVVASREERQEILERREAPLPRFVFLLDESVFWRPVGGPAVMVKQIEHIIEINKLDNVDVRVVRQEVGAYSGLTGAYVHIEFSDSRTDLSDIVFVESQAGNKLYVDDSELIEKCLEQFISAEEVAMSSGELEDFLRGNLRSGWGWTRLLVNATH